MELKGNRGSPDEHVKRMLELLAATNIQNAKEFRLSQVLIRQLLPAMIQAFEHLAAMSNNDSASLPKWKSLRVYHMEGWYSGEFDMSQLRQAFDIANRASLFESTDLHIGSRNDSEPPRTIGVSHLLPSIEQNRCLRSLTMGGNQSLSTWRLEILEQFAD